MARKNTEDTLDLITIGGALVIIGWAATQIGLPFAIIVAGLLAWIAHALDKRQRGINDRRN
jgi:hypothetical protein